MNGTLARMFRSLRSLTEPAVQREARPVAKRPVIAESSFLDMQVRRLRERCVPGCELFIFLPSTPWHVDALRRSQRFASELAQAGHLVVYDCSGTISDGIGVKEIEPNLMLYRGTTRHLATLPDPILWTVLDNVSQRGRYPVNCRMVYDWTENPDVLRRIHERAMEDATVVVSVVPGNAEQTNLLCVPCGAEAEHVPLLLDRLRDRE